MADYIRRDDLFVLSIDYSRHGEWEEAVPVRAIRNIPSADVVEVVRCKDCSHSYKTSYPSELRICLTTGCTHSENHFCSDGKRMDDGT